MTVFKTLPKNDGFRMPAEFEPHAGTILIWPFRGDSWPYGGDRAQAVFAKLVSLISESEQTLVCVPEREYEKARAALPPGTELFIVETDDSWARDYAPTFVTDGKTLRGINWKFNAWGGTYDGLYDSWENDDALAPKLCAHLHCDEYDAHHIVMEGGAFHTDGQGTVITTESCLLSPGRNPKLSKDAIEEALLSYLGAEKVIWLPSGIIDDETNGHVDNICAFTSPGNVVLARPLDIDDPQYASSSRAYDILLRETDAKGQPLNIHILPMPKPVLVTKYQCDGLDLLKGEPVRTPGERLAASYANFYISNSTVIVPGFDDPADEAARLVIAELFPDRKVVTLQSREVLIGGGNFHCLTQQIPRL
ncbi:MAG: agmatine deiminase [Lachnospiraceae bacterium]|nr:agmatine deiminase [Lachnospiraceae bacterium]